LKPNNISDEEAASLPLVSLTSWYAIRKFSGFNEKNAFGKRFAPVECVLQLSLFLFSIRALLIGASGGVGQIATQVID
jgi:NADPH:quinone reductase-like Zn-dependent oxidoreductase